MTDLVEHTFITTNGTVIGYIQSGDCHPQLIVLIHGLGGDAWAWHYLQSALQIQGFASIAVDLLGHGLSSHPNDYAAYDFNLVSSGLNELIASLEPQKLVLVGHCYGGMIAQLLAAKVNIPTQVIIIESFFTWPKWSPWKIIGQPLRPLIQLLTKLASGQYLALRRNYDHFRHEFDWSVRMLLNDLKYTSVKSWLYTYLQMLNFENALPVKRLSVPTLVIWGQKDLITPYSCTRDWQSISDHIQIKTYPLANHRLPLNQVESLAADIADFIGSPTI